MHANRLMQTAALLALFAFGEACGAEEPPPVKLKISKETTFLEGPLHEDRSVDYVKALDQIASKGVTAKNNAAPLMWKAFGPDWVVGGDSAAIAEKLGIAQPSPKDLHLVYLDVLIDVALSAEKNAPGRRDPYFPANADAILAAMSPDDLAVARRGADDRGAAVQAADEAMMKAAAAPWGPKDHPVIAVWLKVNDEPLKLLEEASRRERYYMPVIVSAEDDADSLLFNQLMPGLGASRQAARMLACRAMLRLHEGDGEAAWNDCMTAARLARLLAQEPIVISQLVAISIDALVQDAAQALAASGKMSAAQLKRMVDDWQSLGEVADFVRCIDLAERCALLDFINFVRRNGFESLKQISGGGDDKKLTPRQIAARRENVNRALDPNIAMKRINTWVDDVVKARSNPVYSKRVAESNAVYERLVALKEENTPGKTLAYIAIMILSEPQVRRVKVSERLADHLVAILLPSLMTMVHFDEETRMRRELMLVALALAHHRAQSKQYPAELSELVPGSIAKLPVDRFDQKPLRYRRTADGYVLYSIGSNMRDDGGKTQQLNEDGRPTDLIFSIPKAEAPR